MEDYFASVETPHTDEIAKERSADAPTLLGKQVYVEKATGDYITEAVKAGDGLPNSPQSLAAKVERRALLVAPRYLKKPLPATPNDIFHIHKMLLQYGYEPKNIRILVDGFEKNDSNPTDATRNNILDSLDWLTTSARPGDYRFFYFSGHGTCIRSDKEQGKQAIKRPGRYEEPGRTDHELAVKWNEETQFTRIERLENVDPEDFVYYSEAIVTSHKDAPEPATAAQTLEYDLVRDAEFNKRLSKLRAGSTLVTILDCCHSGRLMNANYKLAGAGFRGASIAVGNSGEGVPKIFRQTDEETGSQEIPIDSSTEKDGLLGVGEDSSAQETTGTSKPRAHNLFTSPLPGRIHVVEALPDEEINRDKIKANLLAWSGSHQRQTSLDTMTTKGGLFTYAFTELIKDMKEQSPTVEQLHQALNQRIAKEAMHFEYEGVVYQHLQYAQVWTSLGDGDQKTASAKLQSNFSSWMGVKESEGPF